MSRDFLPGFNVAANLQFARGLLLLEDCEGTCTWGVAGTGGDDVHEFATAAAFMGLNGMRLKTRATSAAEGDNVSVYKNMGYPETGLLVVRTRIAMVAQAAMEYVELGGVICSGETGKTWGLRFYPAAPGVWYLKEGGMDGAVIGSYEPPNGAFFIMEAVIDCGQGKYVAAQVNGEEEPDIGGVALEVGGATSCRYTSVHLTIKTIAAAPCELYMDSMYVGEWLSA